MIRMMVVRVALRNAERASNTKIVPYGDSTSANTHNHAVDGPPMIPAQDPRTDPIATATSAVISPTARETRPACRRLRRSRPSSSVPSRNPA